MIKRFWGARDELVERVHHRFIGLHDLPYEKLQSLDDGGEDIKIRGRNGFIWTYVERPDDGAVRVIVQGGLPHRWLLSFISQVWAEGFEKRKDGTTRDLRLDEMYDYT
jgi:hypothetical protein